MIAHPALVNRPIVCTAKGIRFCRPPETVFGLLANPSVIFKKKDGEVVRYAG